MPLAKDVTYRTKTTCEWTMTDYLNRRYKTECLKFHSFRNGVLVDNDYIYCPYCGNKIVETEQHC